MSDSSLITSVRSMTFFAQRNNTDVAKINDHTVDISNDPVYVSDERETKAAAACFAMSENKHHYVCSIRKRQSPFPRIDDYPQQLS